MTAAVNDDYLKHHQELVSRHKANFRRHAGAVLDGAKEFHEQTDCGWQWTKTDTHLVEVWSTQVGAVDTKDLQALCDAIDNGDSTPEFDKIVGLYVCRITGKMPDGSRVILL